MHDNIRVYFPSCKITAAFPNSNARAQEYLSQRWHINIAGCCRADRAGLSKQEVPVVVCHTCAAILEESSAAKAIEYIWEYIDKDEQFSFPNYKGERITLQDCTMAKDYPEVMEAVRSLLRKMNFEVVELARNKEQAQFCGLLTTPILPANATLAPKRFGQKEVFTPLSPEQRKEALKQHVGQFTTEKVVCYCKACHGALQLGGAEAVHLLELLFPGK